jgi:branched-subunit amino acid ABC-type transport system permease component
MTQHGKRVECHLGILNFGAITVLVVLGLGMIAGMMGVFNFANGEFVLLGAYATYCAVVIVEQHLQLALSLADYAYVLDRGRIALEGSSSAVS